MTNNYVKTEKISFQINDKTFLKALFMTSVIACICMAIRDVYVIICIFIIACLYLYLIIKK